MVKKFLSALFESFVSQKVLLRIPKIDKVSIAFFFISLNIK